MCNLHNVGGTGHALRVRAPSLQVSSNDTFDDADTDQSDAQSSGNEQDRSADDHLAAGNSPVNAGLQDGANISQDSGHCGSSSFSLKNSFFLHSFYINDLKKSLYP